MRAEVVGRIPGKTAYLRVPWKASYRILTVPDDVIPHGMKTVTELEVELNSPITHDGTCYTALVNVVGEVSAESTKELSQGS